MTLSLGFHLSGNTAAWALVERHEHAPAKVISAGNCTLSQVSELHNKLSSGHQLTWALSTCDGNSRPNRLPRRWPLMRTGPACLLHPAVAAAAWDWDSGRYDQNELHLWLNQDELCCSEAFPGDSFYCREALDAPLGQILERILSRLRRSPTQVVVTVEEQSGDRKLLLDLLDDRDFKVRELISLPEEAGANRAALGAALFALDPTRSGAIKPPSESPRNDPAWLVFFSIALLCGVFSFWLNRQQQQQMEQWRRPANIAIASDSITFIAPMPLELARLLDRRRATLAALEAILGEVTPHSLRELEISTGPHSRDARLRLRLNPEVDFAFTHLPDNIVLTTSTDHPFLLLGRARIEEVQ